MTFECYASSQYVTNLPIEKIKYVSKDMLPITSFIESDFFKKIKVGCSGLRIYLVDKKEIERIDKPIKGVTSWVNTFLYFDFENYLNLSDNYEKKKMIIATFKDGIYRTVEFMGWDMRLLSEAFSQINALDYTFVNISTKKRFKGVKRYMQLEIESEPGFCHYYLAVREHGELISRHKVVSMNAFYNVFFESNRIVSEMRWEDANTFVIVGKKGHLERIRFEYKLDIDRLITMFKLEPDINEKEFMEEYNLATTNDIEKIKNMLANKDLNKWHVYL